jgi:molecular chaperone GrpE
MVTHHCQPTVEDPTSEAEVSRIEDARLAADEAEASRIENARLAANEDTLVSDRSKMMRALRDLEAAKARVERDARNVYDETRSMLVSELLPVLDNFDRAIAAAEWNGDAPAVLEGARMIRGQLESVLHGYGLARFDAVGATFDPAVHDAANVIVVDDPSRDRLVVDQIEPGYTFGERLVRAAKVVIGRYA